MSISKYDAATFAAINPPVLLDKTRVIRRAGWYQLVSPGVKDPTVNEVLMSQIQDTEVEKIVDRTFAQYSGQDLPFKWAIGPMANGRIEERISRKADKSWDFRGMSLDSGTSIPMPDGVVVERVRDSQCDEYVELNLNAWRLQQYAEFLKAKYAAMVSHPRYRCYIVRKDGLAIGTGTTLLQAGYGYLLGAVVLEAFRGSGAYRALVARRLSDLRQEGISYAVTQAKEASSVPILAKLGFQTEYHAKIYQFGG